MDHIRRVKTDTIRADSVASAVVKRKVLGILGDVLRNSDVSKAGVHETLKKQPTVIVCRTVSSIVLFHQKAVKRIKKSILCKMVKYRR